MMHSSDPIYLDHNATTPLLPEVVEAMMPYLKEHFGNPSSGHVYGRRTHQAVETAREQVASLIGSHPDEIVFTSGGTEANNFAITGATDLSRNVMITSVIEHPAVLNPLRELEKSGTEIHRVGVDAAGRLKFEKFTEPLHSRVRLVTVMHSNNETGVLQPIAKIARAAQQIGALVHTDAAQSVGKVPINVHDLSVDLLSIAGHKLYAPKGVGALFIRRGVTLHKFMNGAGHESGRRAGTENVASIVALGKACEVAQHDMNTTTRQMIALRDQLYTTLCAAIPDIQLNGELAERLPNTLNVRFPGVSGQALLNVTPSVAASTGSACHAGHESASAILLAMGLDSPEALSSIRLSLGRLNDEAQIDHAARALIHSWQSLRRTQ